MTVKSRFCAPWECALFHLCSCPFQRMLLHWGRAPKELPTYGPGSNAVFSEREMAD